MSLGVDGKGEARGSRGVRAGLEGIDRSCGCGC